MDVNKDRCEREEQSFGGNWWSHPPMRNALVASLFTGTAFILAHLGLIQPVVEISIYIVVILLGSYYWAREGIEEIVQEREIGIEILMMGATIGAAILGRCQTEFIRRKRKSTYGFKKL